MKQSSIYDVDFDNMTEEEWDKWNEEELKDRQQFLNKIDAITGQNTVESRFQFFLATIAAPQRDPDPYNYIRTIMITGYNKEYNRIKNRDNNCPHHKFKSVSHFCNKLEKIRNNSLKYGKGRNTAMQFFLLLDNAICKQCALLITCKLKQMIETTKLKYLRSIKLDTYFTFCMQYYPIAKVIISSQICFTSLMSHVLFYIKHLEKGMNKFVAMNIFDGFDGFYRYFALLLFQIVRNIERIPLYHWKMMINEKYLKQWMNFILFELSSKQFSRFKFGPACLICLYILTCYALYYFQKEFFGSELYFQSFFRKIKKIQLKQKGMRSNDGNNKVVHFVKNSIGFIGDPSDLTSFYSYYHSFGLEIHKIKRNNTLCQNPKCKIRRKDTDKFWKCKKCRVVRYCSRKCQKIHWNRYSHKTLCKQLRKLRKNK